MEKKTFDKIQHTFMIKILDKVCIEGAHLSIIKAIFNKPTANVTLGDEDLKAFPLQPGSRQRCPLSPLFIQSSSGSPS